MLPGAEVMMYITLAGCLCILGIQYMHGRDFGISLTHILYQYILVAYKSGVYKKKDMYMKYN